MSERKTAKELIELGFTNFTAQEWLDMVAEDYGNISFSIAVMGGSFNVEQIALDAMRYYATQCQRNL